MILTALTLSEFNDLPHYRWVSLPRGAELKVGGNTVAVKIGKECSYKMCKNGREAHSMFESLLSQLKKR